MHGLDNPSEKIAAFMADRLAMAKSVAACQARIAASDAVIDQMAQALGKRELLELPVREMTHYEVSKGAEIVHRHTEPTAPRWPLTVATDGERNGRLAWVPGLQMYRVLRSHPLTERTGEVTHTGDGESIKWHRVTSWPVLGTAKSYEDAREKFGGRPVLERIEP